MSTQPLLVIQGLAASVAGTAVLRGIDLTVNAGEVHAIMGPNGSGKSTLAHVLAGRPGYEITGGTVRYRGADLLALAPEERARAGLFLGFQYPVEIPGVNNAYLLKAALNAARRQRGLPEIEARAMITRAFLIEALPDWLDEEIHAEVEARIDAWLGAVS